jgi:hypothetical protein
LKYIAKYVTAAQVAGNITYVDIDTLPGQLLRPLLCYIYHFEVASNTIEPKTSHGSRKKRGTGELCRYIKEMASDLTKYFREIEKRYAELKNSCDKESLLLNLASLARLNNEPLDYPAIENVNFPETVHIAHAVCHPECGVQEFIVDGSTQKCQRCGGLLFRNEEMEYSKKETA